jgi:hypothetical protein
LALGARPPEQLRPRRMLCRSNHHSGLAESRLAGEARRARFMSAAVASRTWPSTK